AGPAATTARRAKASAPRAPPEPMPQPRVRKPRTTAATCGATDSGNTRAPTTATNPRAPAMTHLPQWVEPAPTPAPGGLRPQALITARPRREATHPQYRSSTRAHRRRVYGRNARTEQRPQRQTNPDGAPPAGFASVTRRAGAKRRTPEGLREAKGAIRWT